MLALILSAWVAACAALGYGLLKRGRYPLNVYGLLLCNAVMLLGVFWMFPLLRAFLGC